MVQQLGGRVLAPLSRRRGGRGSSTTYIAARTSAPPTSIRGVSDSPPSATANAGGEHRLQRHDDRRPGRRQVRLRPRLAPEREGAGHQRHVEHASVHAPVPAGRAMPPGAAATTQTTGDDDHLHRREPGRGRGGGPPAQADDVQGVDRRRAEGHRLAEARGRAGRPRRSCSDSAARPTVDSPTAAQVERGTRSRSSTAVSTGCQHDVGAGDEARSGGLGVGEPDGLQQLGHRVERAEHRRRRRTWRRVSARSGPPEDHASSAPRRGRSARRGSRPGRAGARRP